MKRTHLIFLAALFGFACILFAANPTFQSFISSQFAVTPTAVSIKDGASFTNPLVSSSINWQSVKIKGRATLDTNGIIRMGRDKDSMSVDDSFGVFVDQETEGFGWVDGSGIVHFASDKDIQEATNTALQSALTTQVSTNTEFQIQINSKSETRYPMSFVFATNAPVSDVYNFAVVNAYSPRTKTIYRTFWENNSGQAGTSFGAWQKFSYSTNFGTTWSTPTTIYSNSFYYAANHAFGVTPTGRLINFVQQHIYTNSVIQTNGHSIFTLISDDGGANWTSNVFEFLPWTANSTNLVVPHGRINVTPSGKLVGSIYTTTIGASATETAYCIASTNNGVNWNVIGTITNSVTNNVRLNEVQIWPVNDTFFLAATRNGGSTHSYIFASTNAGVNWYVATDLLQPSGNTGESSPCALATYPGIDGEHMVIAHGDRTKHNMYITDALISDVIDFTGVRNDAGGTLLSNRWQLIQTNSYSQDIAYPSLIPLSGSQLLLSYSFATNNSACYIVDKIVQPSLRVDSVSISGTNTSGYLVATNLSTNSIVGTSANGKDLVSITLGTGLERSGNTINATGGGGTNIVSGTNMNYNALLPTDDTYNGIVITNLTTDGDLLQWDAVGISSEGILTETAASFTYRAIGLTVASSSSGDTNVKVLVHGVVRNDEWEWSPGQEIYLEDSGVSAGRLTQTPPTESGYFLQRIGVALSTNIALINPSGDWAGTSSESGGGLILWNGVDFRSQGSGGGGGTNALPITLTYSTTNVAVSCTTPAGTVTNAPLSFRLTCTNDFLLQNPTGANDGQEVTIEFIQDATGSRIATFDTKWAFGTDITGATLSTTASKRDFLKAKYNATADKWFVLGFTRGY